MITNKDRSKWFGASDTSTLFGSYDTDTFRLWWLVKLGIVSNDFSNKYMDVGNILEIPIINKINAITGENIKLGKRPIYIRKYRIRANLDGYTKNKVIEVKTTKKMFEKVPLNYWRQCQALMFSSKKRICELWVYEVSEEEYEAPYFAEIDENRLKKFIIEYDENWIKEQYIPRVKYLANCLKRRIYPKWLN